MDLFFHCLVTCLKLSLRRYCIPICIQTRQLRCFRRETVIYHSPRSRNGAMQHGTSGFSHTALRCGYGSSSSSSVLGSLRVSCPSPLLCAGFPLLSSPMNPDGHELFMAANDKEGPLPASIWGLQPCPLFPCANLSVFYQVLFILRFLSHLISIAPHSCHAAC